MMYGRLCDEATSALDSSTEGEILTSLRSLANDRTAIFIAHRLTTAMQCDEVNTHLPIVKIIANFEHECFRCGVLLYGSRFPISCSFDHEALLCSAHDNELYWLYCFRLSFWKRVVLWSEAVTRCCLRWMAATPNFGINRTALMEVLMLTNSTQQCSYYLISVDCFLHEPIDKMLCPGFQVVYESWLPHSHSRRQYHAAFDPRASSSDAFVVVRTSIVIVLIKCLILFPIGNVGDLIKWLLLVL